MAWAKDQDRIVLTEDGGFHWTELGRNWERSSLSSAVRLSAELWYVGAGYAGEVCRSEDGGRSFHLRGKVEGVPATIAFPSPLVGYALGPTPDLHPRRAYGISKTDDGGVNWRRLPITVPPSLSLLFLSEERGFVVGEHGFIARTLDGGATWSQATLRVKPFFIRVFFPTPEIGYAVGSRSTIVKTTDGGEHWTVLTRGSERFERALIR
jgi:photosystem II stability/assembly factor-like uncharacterized protein